MMKKQIFNFINIVALVSYSLFMGVTPGKAQSRPDYVRLVRTFELEDSVIVNPAGLAYHPGKNDFHIVSARGQGQPSATTTVIVRLTPLNERRGSTRIPIVIENPINMAIDGQRMRMLFYQSAAKKMVEVSIRSDGSFQPGITRLHNVGRLGLQNAQGMAVDPANSVVFILDQVGPRILRITPAANGRLDNAAFSTLDLSASGLVDPSGLAINPINGNLYVINRTDQRLYEFDQNGQVLTIRDLSTFGITNPQGMVIAPSGDQTDSPSEMSLYLTDSGIATSQSESTLSSSTRVAPGSPNSGQIAEFTFTTLIMPAPAAFSTSLIRSVDLSTISPPSPDPSGIAFISSNNSLMVADGEVEETVSGITWFEGANVWNLTLTGSVIYTANLSTIPPTQLPISNEPVGVAWNPANNHYFFSDDNARDVFEVNPGSDGRIGTADDSYTRFDTAGVGNSDPEGLAFDTWNNRIFVADGVNREVYQFTLSGVLVSQFDVLRYGVEDPESIEFNPLTGTLYVMSSNRTTPVIIETDTNGNLLDTIDISTANPRTAAGLAYGPSSDGSGGMSFYIVDRGVDNNSNPNLVDGRLYELTAPIPPTSGNLPPTVNAGPNQTISLPNLALLDGTVSDDGNPIPPGAVTTSWSQVSGPGPVTLGNLNAVDTTAGFLTEGSYVLRLTANDGEWTPSDEVTITVVAADPDPGLTILNVRVAASSDDAEEKVTGGMRMASSDLDLVYDTGNQTVGMRFNTINIPQGANINNAYIQFQADQANSEVTSLSIQGEYVDNGVTFSATSGNISTRPRTLAAVPWSPSPWTAAGAAGIQQQTPNISPVIQQIVNRTGWTSGNSMVVIITGTGLRTAEAFEGIPAAAPLLHIEYSLGVNQAPIVLIGYPANGATFNQGNNVNFIGTASDVEEGILTNEINWSSNLDGLLGSGGSLSRSNLSVGVHTITATVTDSGGRSAATTTTLRVFPPANVLVGAGDIADAGQWDEATAKLLETIPGTVITLGDHAYPDGSATQFNNYYEPTWGRHRSRTRPAVGDNDYTFFGGADYFNYFGSAAGNPTQGYYSYNVGDYWHVVVLNSECLQVGGCGLNDPQGLWLQADLAANPRACTLAIMHKPLFASNQSSSNGQGFWTILYNAGADVVLSGHYHAYERFAPQNPNGNADPLGIRQFIVGTGGGSLSSVNTIAANSEILNVETYGVLRLNLNPSSYDWTFIPVEGQTFTDSGSANCVTSNTAPVAVNDSYTTNEDTLLTVATPGVLVNDSDPDSASFTAVLNTGPTSGTLNLNSSGSFTYTPNANFNGPVSFTYRANDGTTSSNIATVTITVVPINDPPTAVNDAYTTNKDTPLTVDAPGVLGNDSDPDNASLTAVLNTTPTSGTLTLNSNGSFTYTPDANFNGSDSFSYHANDGTTNSNTATVTINVNPAANFIFDVRVSSSLDDAEERASGGMRLTSSDLELVFDGGNQTVGMRFTGFNIPQGAVITNAYVQFQVNAPNSEATSLTIQGELSSNAAAFGGSRFNISSRSRTTALPWTLINPWTTIDPAGPDQRTPDLTVIIQEIIDQPGWGGNALVIMITGTGQRVAKAFDGAPTAAPLLHVEYYFGP